MGCLPAQTTYQTEIGQTLDITAGPPDKVDLSRFTEKRYKNIVKYKTSFYTAYLPVAAAMYMVREPRLPSLPTDVAFWTGGDRTIWCLH